MTSSNSSEAACPHCGGPTAQRHKFSYPLLTQILFGLSFLAFWIVSEKHTLSPKILIGWSVFQALIGVHLVRARLRARVLELRCIRCGQVVG